LLDPVDSQPQDIPAFERFRDFPDCLRDVGAALLQKERVEDAIGCFELYRKITAENGDEVDSEMLVDQGRCYLALGDNVSAEECLIAAIEADDENIAARFELAKIYEGEQAKEGREEAFLLVTEALNLEAQHVEGGTGGAGAGAGAAPKRPIRRLGPYMPGELRRKQMLLKQPVRRRKYRPRLLGDSEERRKFELERTEALGETFRMCQEMRGRLGAGGDADALDSWMGGARELIDDFRSSKEFYPWDMYVRSQGFVAAFPGQEHTHANANLMEMATRLQQSKALPTPFFPLQHSCGRPGKSRANHPGRADLAPGEGQDLDATPVLIRHEHRGIPFNEWLDIFLEYALNLALAHQAQEAYEVLTAAKDSVVFKNKENAFLIHVAHASTSRPPPSFRRPPRLWFFSHGLLTTYRNLACAVISGDEEQCISAARFFMREYMHCTDSYRIMAALCRVCQAPASWYSSGPVQKFILRQIRMLDKATTASNGGGGTGNSELDVCLLTIYGHIMFTTASYTYALSKSPSPITYWFISRPRHCPKRLTQVTKKATLCAPPQSTQATR